MGYDDNKPTPHELFESPPTLLIFWWAAGTVLFFLNVILTARLLTRDLHKVPSKRRKFVLQIVFAIPVLTSYGYITLFLVRGGDALSVIEKWYQGVMMLAFYQWIMSWVDKPYDVLLSQPPRDYFVAPPCWCLGNWWCGNTSIVARDLKAIKYGLWQLGLVQVLTTVIGIVLDVNGRYDHGPYIFLKVLSVLSMMVAVYALNVLINMTERVLPTLSLSVRARPIIFLACIINVQGAVLTVLGQSGALGSYDYEDSDTIGQMWNSFLILVDCFIFAVEFSRRWPSEQYDDELHNGYNLVIE